MDKNLIDPKTVLASLAATKPIVEVEVVEALGPSQPHDQPALESPTVNWVPRWPKKPEPSPHYINTLDQIWPKFDDPEERTAARLRSLLGETANEAQRVMNLKSQVWENLTDFAIEENELERLDKEFVAYLRRLNEYREALNELDPSSTDTDEVYVGLVKRQEGAGPVPDAIMHMYFANQLGILAEHNADMGKGFVGRVMVGLAKLDEIAEETAETIEDATTGQAEKIRELLDDATQQARDSWRTLWLWVGGALLGTAVVGGAVAAGVAASRKREP